MSHGYGCLPTIIAPQLLDTVSTHPAFVIFPKKKLRLYNAMLPVSVIQTNLLSDNHICTITELHVHCVRSTGSTLITLVHIGYATRSKYVSAQHSYNIRGKIAKRGRIDFSPKLPKMAPIPPLCKNN